MKKSKVIKAFIVCLVLGTVFCFPALAGWPSGSYLKLQAQKSEVKVGQDTYFTVDVLMKDVDGHAGGVICIQWPENDFQVVKITNDTGFFNVKRMTVPLPAKNGEVALFYDGSLERRNKAGAGKVATLTFQLNDTAIAGRKEISFGEIDLFDTVAFADDYPETGLSSAYVTVMKEGTGSESSGQESSEEIRKEQTEQKEPEHSGPDGNTQEKKKDEPVGPGKYEPSGEVKEKESATDAGKTESQGAGTNAGSGSSSAKSGGTGGSPIGGLLSLTYSRNWYTDAKGNWKIKDKTGKDVNSAWLCDDAVKANGQNVWYLMNTDGTMLAVGLVQDKTGNYYSLETRHNGYYGMLRYKNGTYDGIYMEFSQKHDGTFGAITNKPAIDALKAEYGVTKFGIDNSNCVYTAKF